MVISSSRDRRVLALTALLLLGACGESTPRYRVEDGWLKDRSGSVVILRGLNVSAAHKVAPYLDFHQREDFRRVREEWGMNAIRLLVSWAGVEPEEGSYDSAYLDALALRVGWAEEAGLSVVVDMHQDVYGEGFAVGGGNGAPRWTCDAERYGAFVPGPSWFLNYTSPQVVACYDHFWATSELRAHYLEAWRRVAARLARHPGVVGFDAMNEPYWGSIPVARFELEHLQPFYEEVVGAVRAEAPEWVAFLEPASSRNLGLATGLDPFRQRHVMYAPHAYDTTAEQGGGFSLERRQAYLANVAALAAEARALGAGLWIGEYGGMSKHPGLPEYMDAAYDAAASVAAGNMYWEYSKGDGYGLLNLDGSEKRELLDVLVRPYPHGVAGEPLDWSFDEATRAFTLRYRASSSAEATRIVAPARVYPDGVSVSCGRCAHEVVGDSVHVRTTSGEETIVLVPR